MKEAVARKHRSLEIPGVKSYCWKQLADSVTFALQHAWRDGWIAGYDASNAMHAKKGRKRG